jgi:hypothetical protein
MDGVISSFETNLPETPPSLQSCVWQPLQTHRNDHRHSSQHQAHQRATPPRHYQSQEDNPQAPHKPHHHRRAQTESPRLRQERQWPNAANRTQTSKTEGQIARKSSAQDSIARSCGLEPSGQRRSDWPSGLCVRHVDLRCDRSSARRTGHDAVGASDGVPRDLQ